MQSTYKIKNKQKQTKHYETKTKDVTEFILCWPSTPGHEP